MTALEESVRRWISAHTGVALTPPLPLATLTDSVARIRGNFEALAGKQDLDVLFYSPRKEYFDVGDIESFTAKGVRSVTFCGDLGALSRIDRRFDLIIACMHVMREHIALLTMRARALAPLVVAW